MKKIFLLSLSSLFLLSCGSSRSPHNSERNIIGTRSHHVKSERKVKPHHEERVTVEPTTEELFDDEEDKGSYTVKQEIIDFAKSFQGTRYKYGGTTKAGMDCSGLVSTAFLSENIQLPRSSRDMAKKGVPISIKDIEEGDLVFFKTSSKNIISHVGLVVKAERGQIRFIHSTTHAGVIISSLDEAYWKKAFVEVRRVI